MKAISYSENVNDPYGHNKGYEQEGKGNQVGKDVIIEKFGAKDDGKTDNKDLRKLHKQAKDVYIRSLKEKQQDENEGNDEIM